MFIEDWGLMFELAMFIEFEWGCVAEGPSMMGYWQLAMDAVDICEPQELVKSISRLESATG